MAQNLNLNKEVFNKRVYQRVIDTSFKELGVKVIQEELDDEPTIQELFNLYNELFYEIKKRGSTNSHEYIVRTSGEYISFEEKDILVQALEREIAELRKEILQAQQDLSEGFSFPEEETQPVPEIDDIEVGNPIDNIPVDIIDPNPPNPDPDTFDPNTPPPPPPPPPPSPYPNANAAAEAWVAANGLNYKTVPISARMLVENFNTLSAAGNFPHMSGDGYDYTDNLITKIRRVLNSFHTQNNASGRGKTYAGSDVGAVYLGSLGSTGGGNYIQQDVNQFILFDDAKYRADFEADQYAIGGFNISQTQANYAKANIAHLLTITTDYMKLHYENNHNFEEDGGIII